MPAGKITCEAVKEFLELNGSIPFEKQTILLVDCRPFFTFNDCHIRDAVNVFCSKFLLRRKGQLLEKIFTDERLRSRIISGSYFNIVLYEERDIISGDSLAELVANCLKDEADLNCVYFLQGGFSEFSKQFPSHCESSNTTISAISDKVNELTLGRCDSGLEVSQSTNSKSINKIENLNFSTHTWPFKMHHSKHHQESATADYKTGSKTIHNKKSCLQLNLQPNERDPFLNFPREISFDSTDDEEHPEPSELTPFLFIGSQAHSNSLDVLSRLGITAILNVSSCCPNYFESEFLYKKIFLRDTGDGDIQSVMNESIDFINEVRKREGKVLVHCRAGMSRSATMCIAYLIKHNNWSMDKAYEYVKSRRPQIAPNFSFMVQMMEFEKKLLRASPTDELSPTTSSSTLSSSSEASTPSSASSSIS